MPQQDTLPEKDTETGRGVSDADVDDRVSGLEDQFADDKSPGEGVALGTAPQPSDDSDDRFKKNWNIVGKRWKFWGAIIGAFFAVIAPFVLFFLFLFLFKLNHFKELFIEYRFAKFDRVVSERLRAALDEAKNVPAGEAGAEPAAADAPLEIQLAQAKADGGLPEPNTTEAANLESKISAFEKSNLASADGVITDDEFGVKDRSIDEVDSAKSDTEVKAAIDEDLRNRVDDPKTSEVPKGAGELEDKVKETKESIKKGATPETASQAASESIATKFASGAADTLNAAFKLTLLCIALDIWGAGKKAYVAYKAGGLVRAAESVYTWADAQKQGKASLAGIGAVAGKLDNSQESAINSAGAQQASGQPITGPALSAEARPSSNPPFGLVGQGIDLLSRFPGLTAACHELLKPQIQLAIAGGSLAVLVAAIASGGTVLTLGFVVTTVTVGLATVISGPIGKALLVHEVATLAHAGISANAGPIEWGNYLSGGTEIMADSACLRSGCKQLTPQQATALNLVIKNEQIAHDKQKGLTYRLVASSNPRSVLSQTLFKLPSTPSALIGRMDHFFATIFNPSRFAMAGGKLALETYHPSNAYAELTSDGLDPVTGLPQVGVPLDARRWRIIANSKVIEANKEKFKAAYEKCYPATAEDYAQRIIDYPNSDCDKATSEEAARYDQYKADSPIIRAAMLLANKKPLQTAAGTAAITPVGGNIDLATIYDPSDKVACAAGTNSIEPPQTGYRQGNPVPIRLCTLPNLSSSSSESSPGDEFYINGANGLALVNSRASGAFLALVTAAKTAGLPIGATSTFRTMAHQQCMFNDICGQNEAAPPGYSNHQMGLAIDFSCNDSLVTSGDPCYSWLTQNAGTYGIKNYPAESWHWSVDGH